MNPPAQSAAPSRPAMAGLAARLRTMPRRHLLLITLLPVLVLCWLPLLRGKAAPGPAATATPAAVATPGPAAIPGPGAAPLGEGAFVPGSPAAILELGRRVRAARAPFAPRWRPQAAILGDAPVPDAAERADTPGELVPTAILLSRDGPPVAIVQGLPRRVGDTILDHTIVAIGEGRVDYVCAGRQATMTLPAPRSGGSR